MESFNIKATIYDFFAYFMSGIICSICIILAIYFAGFQISPSFKDIFIVEFSFMFPKLFLLLIFILINYILGLLLSTLSSLVVENLLIKKIRFLSKHFNINNIVSENTYNIFMQNFTKEFNATFNKSDIRLLTTLIENKAVNSYGTAFVFLTIYGTYRNICVVFFTIGVIIIIMSAFLCTCIIFGIILILFSIISFIGYIRFYRYFISQIISTYVNIEKITETKISND